MSLPARRRLPQRRPAVTCSLEDPASRQRLTATVGLSEDRPTEVFLAGAKDGSGLAAILDDASVVISVALQYGVPAAALAKSVARIPERLDGPAVKAASVIGAALDLVIALSSEELEARATIG